MSNKKQKIDGFGPDDSAKVRKALRQVWSWSYPRRLVKQRCLQPDGFSKCEKCGAIVANVVIDHIKNVGDVDEGFIKRLFVPSNELQGLCKKTCHDPKTKEEHTRMRKARKKREKITNSDDFF